MFALTVLAAACVETVEPGLQKVNDVETTLGSALHEHSDASAGYAIEVEKLRAMKAETERLRAETAEIEAEVAALKEKNKNRRARHVERLSLGESLSMAALSMAIAAVASQWERGKSSRKS